MSNQFKRMSIVMGALLSAIVIASPAAADTMLSTGGYSRELRTTKMMGMMDADGDHRVTKDEFIKHQEKVFQTMARGKTMIDPQNWLRSITNN